MSPVDASLLGIRVRLDVVVDGLIVRVLVVGAVVQEELHEDAEIQQEGTRAAGQPREVDEQVPAVDGAGLARTALVGRALGFERQDGEHVGQVAEAGEEEEQHAHALGRFPPPVEQELG